MKCHTKLKPFFNICTFLLFVFLFGCQTGEETQQISFSTIGPDKNIEFILNAPGLKQPFTITNPENEGSIFYETKDGRTWVNGDPETVNASDGTWHGKWTIDDREVTLEINTKSNDFNISFSAAPQDDILGWGFNVSATDNEYFTGLMERTVDGHQDLSWSENTETRMNLRGETIEMLVKPTLAIYSPFFLSSNGYGLFVNGTWPGKYDMCDTYDNIVQIAHEGTSMTFTIYTSSDPAEIVKKHSTDAGLPILPPKWAFSPWRWRDNHSNLETYYDGSKVAAPYNSMLTEDILMMEALDIPYSAYWVDRPWAKGPNGYDDFEWDPERFPNAEDMIHWLSSKNKKFMLWIAPWVNGDMAIEAMQKGYFLPSKGMAKLGITKASLLEDDQFVEDLRPKLIDYINSVDENDLNSIYRRFIGNANTGTTSAQQMQNVLEQKIKDGTPEELKGYLIMTNENRALVDFTNPEAKSWWQEQGMRKILADSVAGFKLDRSEEIIPARRDVYAYDGRSTREIRNDYPVQYVQATYEISNKMRGDDFLLFPRAAYTGSAQYSGFWGGDIQAPQEGLRAAIIAELRSAVMGFPVWGSDIGGYWGGFDREVTSRWLAFGCFSPIMEVGPLQDRGLWDLEEEPSYDPEFLATWRLYAKLHDHLNDYTYKYAKEAHETGMPIARPLFLAYPEQEGAWSDWQTFLYGEDILVSAIWKKGTTSHECYLPKGSKWIDAWDTNQVYDGGQKINIETPLYKIPIFVRQGSNIELPDLNKLYNESIEITKEMPDIKALERKAFGD